MFSLALKTYTHELADTNLRVGCLPFTQTTRVKFLCINIKNIKFDVEGERLATKYIQVSWTDQK